MKKILFLFFICIACMLYIPNTIFAASVPSAPTIKSFTANSTSSITIKWGSVSGATKYKVVRRESDEESYTTLTSSCTSTSYTDTGLTANGKYYYRVYAINSAGTSARSTTYLARTKPNTPVISSVSRDSSSQLTVTWAKVSGATKYKLVYRRGDQDSYTTLSSTLTGTSYTHTGLTPNSKYWYRVYAIVDASVGPVDDKTSQSISSEHSESFGRWTLFPRATNTVYENDTSQLTLSWKTAYGGSSSYYYEIYRTDKGSTPIKTTTSTTYTDTGLTGGTIYQYTIKTISSDTEDVCTSTGTFYAAPKCTVAVTATPASATSMLVSWEKPSGGSGLVYNVRRYNSSTSEYETIGTTSSTSFIDTGLTTGNTYKYYIQIRDSNDYYVTSTYSVSTKLEILPTGIALDKTATSVEVSGTLTLTATISPSNSTSTAVTWISSDTSVATVSSNGVITPKAEGSTVITVKTSNSKTASCTVTVTSCSHTYGDWVITAEADCETNGSKYRTCSKCGFTETAEISAIGHNYGDWITETEATCGEDGSKYRICSNCGKTETNSISATREHNYGEWNVDTEATCIEEGSKHRECNICGTVETEIINVTDHSYELTNDVSPTIYNTQGTRTYTCSVCGDSYTEKYTNVINEGIITLENQTANPGDTVTIPVYISDNPGILAFTFKPEYDENALTLTSIEKGELIKTFGTFTITDNGVNWVNTSKHITEDGELFKLNFDIAEAASASDYAVTLLWNDNSISSIVDEVAYYVNPTISPSKITMAANGSETETKRGDVNLDNNIDGFDQILLGRYLSHYAGVSLSDEQAEAADVFTDGIINTMDGSRLAMLIAENISGKSSETTNVSAAAVNSISLYSSSESEDMPIFEVGSCEGVAGYYVDVPVSISNNSGISGFNVKLNYDSSLLTPVSIESSSLLYGDIISNLQQDSETVDFSSFDYVTVYWVDEENMTDNGILFTVRFLINTNVEIGDIIPVELSYDEGDICAQNLNSETILEAVNPSLSQGFVKVIENIYSTGDIDGNGSVDKVDAALLLKHLSGISELSDIQLATAADYNSDSSVDMLDVIGILQVEQ